VPDLPGFEPLRHHGDVEARDGLLDFAVNVYDGPRPPWLDAALRASLDAAGRYPSAAEAERALAHRHDRTPDEVVATAGAAEAFSLVARLRPWRRPVVVHPQFTEPHAALEQAGHAVTEVVLPSPFVLDPALVPDDADLVVVGNPTNPTGVLHPRDTLRALLRDDRLVVVDEAFMDAVPGEPETLLGARHAGLLVVRSLTKHWGIPGVRAGYAVGAPDVVDRLRAGQVPWSVSSTAAAAMVACSTDDARTEAERRAGEIESWRHHLEESLSRMGIPHIGSRASFVLAEVGPGVHAALRQAGVAVRRADTFPGLGPSWVRIAVRPPTRTRSLLDALSVARADALG
jgi:histidinol-phosphate/aromatic aminotransferase/cobyric acid decarboxylase-like protein